MFALVTRGSGSLLPADDGPAPVARWFSSRGSVIRREAVTEVFVGGTLVGSFEADQQFERNAKQAAICSLLYWAAAGPVHPGALVR